MKGTANRFVYLFEVPGILPWVSQVLGKATLLLSCIHSPQNGLFSVTPTSLSPYLMKLIDKLLKINMSIKGIFSAFQTFSPNPLLICDKNLWRKSAC